VPADEATERATSEAAAQFEQQRAKLVKMCWTPALNKPGPPVTKFRMHVLFDGQGQQVGRSFLEAGNVKAGVAQCVNITLPALTVTPAGTKLTLDVPLSLP
jgi:hypothetical protein